MKRRRYTDNFKLKVVNEVLNGESTTIVERRHSLCPTMLSRWVREYKINGKFGNKKDKK